MLLKHKVSLLIQLQCQYGQEVTKRKRNLEKWGKIKDPFSSCSLQKWNPAKPIGLDHHQTPSCLVTTPKFDGAWVRKPNGPKLFK